MEKLLIHLYVPALMQDFDLFVPRDVPVGRLISVITAGLVQLSFGRYGVSNQECLMADGANAPFQPDRTLNEYGIKDGQTMLLI